MKRTLTVHTRLDKKSPDKRPTVLTLDFGTCTRDDLVPLAEDSIVIGLQSEWRRRKSIPAKLEVDVKQWASMRGMRREGPPTVEGVQAQMGALDAEANIRLLMVQFGLTEAEARKIVGGKAPNVKQKAA